MTNLRVPLVLCFVLLLTTWSADGWSQSRKRLRELEKMEESHEDEEAQAEAEGRERHMSIQNKSTRKEMKRYKKLSKQYNQNRRPLFSKNRRGRRGR